MILLGRERRKLLESDWQPLLISHQNKIGQVGRDTPIRIKWSANPARFSPLSLYPPVGLWLRLAYYMLVSGYVQTERGLCNYVLSVFQAEVLDVFGVFLSLVAERAQCEPVPADQYV